MFFLLFFYYQILLFTAEMDNRSIFHRHETSNYSVSSIMKQISETKYLLSFWDRIDSLSRFKCKEILYHNVSSNNFTWLKWNINECSGNLSFLKRVLLDKKTKYSSRKPNTLNWQNNSTVCSYESVVDLENPIYLLWKELMWKVEDSQRRVSGTTQPRWNRSRQQQTEKTNVRRNRWSKKRLENNKLEKTDRPKITNWRKRWAKTKRDQNITNWRNRWAKKDFWKNKKKTDESKRWSDNKLGNRCAKKIREW